MKQNLIYGVNSVLEKLRASPEDVIEILLSDISGRAASRKVSELAARLHVHMVSAEPRFLDQLVGGQRHQGVVARTEPYRYLPFGNLLEEIAEPSRAERILILDGLTDPRNFGALLRTADGAGVHYVIIPRDRSVEATAVAVKTSAGAAHHIKIAKVTNLHRAILDLKKLNFWIVGLDVKGTETIYAQSFPERIAIVLGGEGKGARPLILRDCDFLVSIPMLGKVDSLNVSVAGAVLLYELLRQRREFVQVPRPRRERN